MINKGNCKACKRKIQETLLDKCMFCGEALVGDQKFTEAEKDAIRVREEHHREMDEIRREGDETYERWKKNDPYSDFF